ncbi:hypothetical protein [Acinetobacter sp. MD2]|uniref:lysozyme inhibitor LprI family protein n=1 Tax=Acinetobacter sp. MD2 TaxID=2600066 RepID=UPI002D1ED4AF|nr:hypothetical protein [Acinetobacter sp. MD2]MEB3767312.1 hypothetical protein [Acinetobacter sp. MD2]
MQIKFYVSICLIGLSSSFSLHAASFSCNQAMQPDEKTICQVRHLNDADVKMATTYALVLHALPMGGREQQKSVQAQWLKQRHTCGKQQRCLTQLYQQRQQQLDDIVQSRILSQGPF